MIPPQDLPTGLVTFLFSDIEGSTWLWEQHGQKMREALARHDEILRLAVHEHSGHIVKTTGDGVHAVFIDALYGLSAAVAAQRELQGEAWLTIEPDAIRVRIGIHSGTAELRDGDYYGSTLNIAARLMSAGHGGQILVSEATGAIASPELPDGFSLRDLGRYQLNGIREPQRVLQLNASDLPSGFPELKARNTAVRNLPGQTTPFIGRRRELAEIQRLLVETDCRLLTLTGPGGMGKTRTAIEAARSIAAENGDLFPDGITFVPLAPVDDLETALRAIADALDYQFGSDEVPQDKQLLTVLSEKRLLLLIDNLEHLLAEGLATFIANILHVASGVKLLVTSRERINLQAETHLALSGLDGDLPQSINDNTLPKGNRFRCHAALCTECPPVGARFWTDRGEYHCDHPNMSFV